MDAGVPNNDVFTGRALTDRAGQNSIARQCFFNAARQHRFSVRVSDTFPPKPNHKPIPHSNPNTDPINPNSNPADPNLTLTPLNLPLTLTVTEQGRGMSNREIVPGGGRTVRLPIVSIRTTCFFDPLFVSLYLSQAWAHSPPLKLRPYGGTEMCILLLLLLLLLSYNQRKRQTTEEARRSKHSKSTMTHAHIFAAGQNSSRTEKPAVGSSIGRGENPAQLTYAASVNVAFRRKTRRPTQTLFRPRYLDL